MMGGMGGGMGGGLIGSLMKGVMGGMNGNPSVGQPQMTETIADDYDVARWKRADGLDAAPTMVQTVRADWDKKNSEKQEKSPLKKLLSKFSRKKNTKSTVTYEPEPRPAGGTVVTPEMKKATQRINPTAEQNTVVEPPKRKRVYDTITGKNYLGLSFRTEIDDFFTMNPINSAILAVDSLGMGLLTLNQVTTGTPGMEPAPEMCQEELPQDIADQPSQIRKQTGGLQNLIAQRTDTNYMNEFHKSREQQKYNVRIR